MSLVARLGELYNYAILLLLLLQPINQTIYQPSYESTNQPTNQKPTIAHLLAQSLSNYALLLLLLLQPTNYQSINHPTNRPTTFQPKASSHLNQYYSE